MSFNSFYKLFKDFYKKSYKIIFYYNNIYNKYNKGVVNYYILKILN